MPTQLDHYRLLGRSGLRVSPLCLGTMTFGTEWRWGADKETSRALLDAYAERGGNFIDTANRYTEGTSESFLGEFLEGRREQFVVATKFSLYTRKGDPNAVGNHRKNMVRAAEASLRRLRTDYIDLYWMHAWDGSTPADEVMRALDDLVRAGKVLYAGVSDTPAWKVAQMNTLADLRGWSPFIALQVRYSLADRTVERDLLPMARELKLGVTPWAALAAGVLTGKYNAPRAAGATPPRLDVTGTAASISETKLRIAAAIGEVARESGYTPSQIAHAWLLSRDGVTSPILGVRTPAQLEDSLMSLSVELSPEHRQRLDDASAIELGFPHDFLADDYVQGLLTGGAHIEPRR